MSAQNNSSKKNYIFHPLWLFPKNKQGLLQNAWDGTAKQTDKHCNLNSQEAGLVKVGIPKKIENNYTSTVFYGTRYHQVLNLKIMHGEWLPNEKRRYFICCTMFLIP